jgi:uncharacterized protein YneF (UPF0154 family)
MARRAFDQIASAVGVMVVVALLVAGGLLTWGYVFSHNNVHDQLQEQQIFFPPKSTLPSSMIHTIGPYAGQQVLTGQQAKVYADDYIGVHLSEMPYGGVYSKVSTAARAATPGSAQAKQLAELQSTVFMGTTLRGLLLQAYAFGTIATLLFWGAIACFVLAIIMAIFVFGGIWHARRTSPEKQLFGGGGAPPAS